MTTRLQTKDIFVAYADEDRTIAHRLREVLATLFGDRLWLRDFDMNSGELISEALFGALGAARWVVILLSQQGVKSSWISKELHHGAITSLVKEGVNFVIVKCEECEIPPHLAIPLYKAPIIDLSHQPDMTVAFMDLASYIETAEPPDISSDIYEGRGEDSDRAKTLLRRNRVIFVLGWRGIGKTAFVKRTIADLLHKRALTIRLTSGFSLDRLSREIISLAHVRQPIEESNIDEDQLLAIALAALKDRESNFVLFLDDAQEAIDGINRLLPYLDRFLLKFLETNINTPIMIATTRLPYHSIEINKESTVFRLGRIKDEYIEEMLHLLLLQDTPERGALLAKRQGIEKLVQRIGGHPTAAIRMAGLMKIHPFDLLEVDESLDRFQIGMAGYVLGVTRKYLQGIDDLLMKTLAVIGAPMTISDLLAIPILTADTSTSEIHESVRRLVEWFLVESDGEFIYLHGFMEAYYKDTIRPDSDLRDKIAASYGIYAFEQAKATGMRLREAYGSSNPKEADLALLSNRVYRYSLPADKLLRTVGRDDLANRLPIRSKGTLRNLVYYFYQDVRNYRVALEYAEQWLQANPDDFDIQIQRIKCYRRIGDRQSYERALQLIDQLEIVAKGRRPQQYLLRERGLIAQSLGDSDGAKTHFGAAIAIDERNRSRRPYSEVYADLAKILLDEVDSTPEWIQERGDKVQEALRLLEIAKRESDNFARYHLSKYVNALILAGKEHIAIPLLEEALYINPNDGVLNHRKSEIHRRKGEYDRARHYAEIGIKEGYAPCYITYANILYDEATFGTASAEERSAGYDEALSKLNAYRDRFSFSLSESELEVAAAVMSKVYRAKGDIDAAYKVVERSEYRSSGNPHMVYEQATVLLRKAESVRSESIGQALSLVQTAIGRVDKYPYALSDQLVEVRSSALHLRDELVGLMTQK